MRIYQSNLFARKVKKLHHNQKLILDKAIQKILEDPKIGNAKKGDLKGIFVYKFKIQQQQFLLSYRKKGKNLELVTIGTHENYYRDLKTYLKTYEE